MLEGLDALRPLLVEIGNAKRIRTASTSGSLSEEAFRRSWARLCAGEAPERVALSEAAAAVARARLAGIDGAVLAEAGLSPDEAQQVLERGFDEVAAPIDAALAGDLRAHLPSASPPCAAPALVDALARQPRAGATCPGKPRLVVEPPESHADHCFTVAVYGVLVAPLVGADPVTPFLTGLAHHLHNVVLPDAGFAGEVLLGDHLDAVLARLERRELEALPHELARQVSGALATRDGAAPEGRAFHAADVLDRVLQVHHHAASAAFTAAQALEEQELVHAGPVQAFHHEVLAAAGL